MSSVPTAAHQIDGASTMLDGHAVLTAVSLGTVLRYFDGTPQPPARHSKKLRAWQSRNSSGRLVEKSPGASSYPAGFVLHEGTYTSDGTPIIIVRRHYFVTTDLRFEILERPQPGMVRVLTRWNGKDELQHLAPDMAAAEAWAARNRYSNLVLETVEDDEAPVQLGRVA